MEPDKTPKNPEVVTPSTPATPQPATPPSPRTTEQFIQQLEPAQRPAPQPKKHQNMRDFLSILAVIASALLLAFVLISFVFQSYQVDGPSMQGALNNNDHLIVWKVSRTIARITHHTYIPNRGDIVIFNAPPTLAEFGAGNDKQLIKRVIGLPGDHVVVKNGVITIYNQAHPNGFDPDKTLPYNDNHHIPVTGGNVDITLAPGQIFVCGDNRPDSLDSRDFGPINANSIIGKLVVRVLPLTDAKRF